MSGLDKSITEGLASFMNKMAQDKLPEYDSAQLSEIQSKVVKTEEKNVIVVAGAGSGKTRVLTERIKYLINEKGVDPSGLVAITFTNMAADEMRERLQNVQGIGDAFIGTIHSFANKIFANSGSEYEIYNDAKENEFHRYLIEHYCSTLTMNKYLQYKDMIILVDQGRASESDLDEFLYPSERYELQMIESKKPDAKAGFPETVTTLMQKYNVITFDQLLEEATKYFQSLNSRLEYLFVDEFQDIGQLEYKFIKSLNAVNNFYVGDDWQSIYGFKGGNVRIFKNLIKDKSFKTYYLEDNYRNAQEIIDLASKVIDQIDDKVDKKIRCKVSYSGKVTVDTKYNLSRYLESIKKNGNYGDWFLLVRTNKEIMRISSMLESMQVPYSTFKKADMTLAEMRLEMNSDTIKLLTVHTAKGLETKRVILTGNFPIKQPPYLKNADERKVMYVGITRAQEELILLN